MEGLPGGAPAAKHGPSMAGNFRKYDRLIDDPDVGWDGVHDFLMKPMMAGDLVGMGHKKPNGMQMDTPTYGSAIFGPKIGHGFYQNLMGNFHPITQDQWFVKTFGRWAGTLRDIIKGGPAAKQKLYDKMRGALHAEGAGYWSGTGAKAFKTARKVKSNAALLQLAGELKTAHEADFRSNRALYNAAKQAPKDVNVHDARRKSPLTAAALRVHHMETAVQEDPGSGAERNWRKDIAEHTRGILNAEGHPDLKNADLQAVIWYPEKDYYRHMGSTGGGARAKAPDEDEDEVEDDEADDDENTNNVDYSRAYQDILRQRGKTDDEIRQALGRPLDTERQPVGQRHDAGRPGPAGAPDVGSGAEALRPQGGGVHEEAPPGPPQAVAEPPPQFGVGHNQGPPIPEGYAAGGEVQDPTAEPPNPVNTETQSRVGDVRFDQHAGAGQTPNNGNVNYLGFTAMMKPSKFLSLSHKLDNPRPGHIEGLRDHLAAGNAIGSPFLRVDTDEEDPDSFGKVGSHDGRHRMRAIQAIQGDTPVPVHIFGSHGDRARHLTPEHIARLRRRMVSQGSTRESNDNFEDAFHLGKVLPARPQRADGGEVDPAAPQPNAQGLYSQAAKAAMALGQTKGSPQQMLASLKGVKPDELKWSGAQDAFAGQPSVTKQQLAGHFQAGLPQIEETTLGSSANPYPHHTPNEWEGAVRRARAAQDPDEVQRLHTAWAAYEGAEGAGGDGAAKFQQYTVPGGQNYRELLMHLASQGRKVPLEEVGKKALELAEDKYRRHGSAYADKQFMDYAREDPVGQLSEHDVWVDALHHFGLDHYKDDVHDPYTQNAHYIAQKGAYRSSHWEQPNVLAHLRLSDRRGRSGEKLLHLEELQSDWGQEGRKKGFRDPAKPWELFHTKDGRPVSTHATEAEAEMAARGRPELDYAKHEGPPPAPYVTKTEGWTDLGLKRLLHEAAKGGYDKVVWTPGEEQAERYDLSKHVKHLDYWKNKGGTYRLAAGLHNGDRHELGDAIPEDKLADHVGKEAAEKIVGDEGKPFPGVADPFGNPQAMRRLAGLDLRVGGEGMKGYYDNILPKRLLALAKEHDPEAALGTASAQVGSNLRPVENESPLDQLLRERNDPGAFEPQHRNFPALTITPKMRESILRNGFKAYAYGGRAARAGGGGFPHASKPHLFHSNLGHHLHVGPIHSAVHGRTDHLPMHVPSGSYVLPADVVSANGQGNTIAGFKTMRRLFGGAPYGGGSGPYGQGAGPYGEALQNSRGGRAQDGGDAGVPIVAAGGEYVLSPDQVRAVGGGDPDLGTKVLDEFVKRSRARNIKTLQHLPGPAKD